MTLTRSFRETVKTRIENDPAYGEALFEEALQLMFEGDLDAGKHMLRDYINATVGFKPLAAATDINDKSLMRMFSDAGNPTVANLFKVVAYLQEQNSVTLKVNAA